MTYDNGHTASEGDTEEVFGRERGMRYDQSIGRRRPMPAFSFQMTSDPGALEPYHSFCLSGNNVIGGSASDLFWSLVCFFPLPSSFGIHALKVSFWISLARRDVATGISSQVYVFSRKRLA